MRDSAIDARLAGYTEWHRPASAGVAYVTIGWDWYLERATGAFVIAGGDVRSNVMVTDATGADIGMVRTAAALAARLACIDWPPRSRRPCSGTTTPIMPVRRSSDNWLRLYSSDFHAGALYKQSATVFNPLIKKPLPRS